MSDTPITEPQVIRTEAVFVFDPPGSFEQLSAELLTAHNEIIKLGGDPEQTKLVSVETQKPGVKLTFETPLNAPVASATIDVATQVDMEKMFPVEDEESSDD